MVAPTVVGTPTTFASATSGSTIVLDKPAGAQNGDMLVAILRTNGSTSAADFALTGWTRRGYTFKPNDGAGRVFGIYTHPVTDATTEPSTYTFSKAVADARRVGAMFLVRGVDLTNPVAGNSVNWDATATPRVQLNSFAVDTTDAALLVYAWGVEIVSPNATAPTITPSTAVALVPSAAGTTTTRTTIWAGAEPISGGATTGARSLTWASATGEAASGVVLRGLAAAPTPKPGFSSVAQMLATPGATWAHRGGSANRPEMSEYAYDQAVLAGYGALEFSANRTSDGVWPGVHDASLNRTSQTSGLPDISTMTWAQVQTYQNSLNSAGTPRPYYRLDAFLDKFTSTHVAIVDPKHAIGTYNTEFLNLLDAHGGPSKIVVKFYGAGSGAVALADAAAARGYQTWGYFYDTDVTSGELAAWQSHWSILGMNYDAPQSAWDAVLAYGKPVVGHIAGSQANYDTAINRGARMVQCANVEGIRAVGATNIITAALPALQSASTGTSTPPAFSGSVSQTLPPLSGSATGATTPPAFTATVGAVLPAIGQAAAGATVPPEFVGAVTAALPALSSAADGVTAPPLVGGDITALLPALTSVAAGTITDPVQAGTVTMLLPALVSAALGTVQPPGFIGNIASVLPNLSSQAHGTVTNGPFGIIAAMLPALTAEAAGTVGDRDTRMVFTPTSRRLPEPVVTPRRLSAPVSPR
ncbi:hypothetical protein MRBLWO14_001002 [Microbacterium sp. LWO14-1.2]|uniref:glycerophosphodiester phosphodiesterase n=1 Tax=Microbacterium sp. LWO14-1.2 TaxID=3135263 RepID=UPI0031394724